MPPKTNEDSYLFICFGILLILLKYIIHHVHDVVTGKRLVFICNVILHKNAKENIALKLMSFYLKCWEYYGTVVQYHLNRLNFEKGAFVNFLFYTLVVE